MKKLNFLLAAATLWAAGSTISSCKKETVQQAKTTSTASNHQYATKSLMKSVSVQGFEPNTMTWAQLTIGTDPQDVLYRKAQLYLSIGLTEVMKDSTIADWLTRQTLVAEDNVIHFDALFTQFPATKQIMESVPDPLGVMDNYTFEQVQEQMQYGGYNIKASIFLANAEMADPTYKPITTPGYDLDMGDEDTHPSDVVLGWHLSDNNTISRISMWEEITDIQAAPILAIDGRATNLGNMNKEISPSEAPGDPLGFVYSDNTNYRVSMVKFKINYRYDVGNTSELKVIGTCSYRDGSGWQRPFLKHSCVTGGTMGEKIIANIHKRDIGKLFTGDSYFCRHHSPVPLNLGYGEYDHNYPYGTSVRFNRKLLTYNTFEFDGFASRKPLSPATVTLYGGGPSTLVNVGLRGNMSKYDEWYLFPPSWSAYTTLAASPMLELPYPRIGWSRYNSSGKGDLEIKTIDWCTF